MENVKVQPNYKKQARDQMEGKLLKPIVFTLVYGIITAMVFALIHFIFNINLSQSVFYGLILLSPLTLSSTIFYVKFSKNQNPGIMDIISGFKSIPTALILYLILNIPDFVHQLILQMNIQMGYGIDNLISVISIIISILISLNYLVSYYIIADEENTGVKEALSKSRRIMQGHKLELFLLNLSFIGWWFLSMLTLGIALLWVIPYMELTLANFFLNIKEKYYE